MKKILLLTLLLLGTIIHLNAATFEENKKAVNELVDYPSKKVKNQIAGYITRKIKKMNKGEIYE